MEISTPFFSRLVPLASQGRFRGSREQWNMRNISREQRNIGKQGSGKNLSVNLLDYQTEKQPYKNSREQGDFLKEKGEHVTPINDSH